MVRKQDWYKTSRELILSARVFPYGRYLITTFPFYAILMRHDLVSSPLNLLLIAPFVPYLAAVFMYNTICDAKTDPAHKNPLVRKTLSPRIPTAALLACLLLSFLIFMMLCRSKICWCSSARCK